MKKLNIFDLHSIINKKNEIKYECYDFILEKIHKKIVQACENKKTICCYEVPDFIIGFPLINLNECIIYLIDALKKNGFIVQYFLPNIIYISWDINDVEKTKERNISENKNIDVSKKKTGKYMLDFL